MSVYTADVEVPRIAPLGGGNCIIRRMTDITVLVGKNGSGKSVLLRGWRDLNLDGVHYVAPERTGEMDFQPNYLQEEFDSQHRRNYSTRNFVPEYRRRILSRVQTYFMVRGNFRGSEPPGDPSEIEQILNSLVSDFSLRLLVANPPYELKRIASEEIIRQVDQLSSGEAQLLTIGLDILTIAAIWEIEGKETKIILIDEPDAHIHPDLQARFADFIFRVADRFGLQVVIATHSTSLLAALGQFGGVRTSVVYLNRNKNEYIARPFDSIQKEIASCLGGHVLMGPLFGAPILLVEGDDDYRIWGQVPRHGIINVAVIPTNGDEIFRYQRTLDIILSSLGNPGTKQMGFALLDGDKSLPTPNPDNQQLYISFIQLNCHEAENLYLTDEVLNTLGITWEEASVKINEESNRFGGKAEFLSLAQTWERRSVDIKIYMNEISQILDPKPIHWTVRVGTTIGRSKPMGQLADFLGDQVLEALWGES